MWEKVFLPTVEHFTQRVIDVFRLILGMFSKLCCIYVTWHTLQHIIQHFKEIET